MNYIVIFKQTLTLSCAATLMQLLSSLKISTPQFPNEFLIFQQDKILSWIGVFKLPPIGSSDHNAILVKPYGHRSQKPNNGRKMKRDLRNSRVRSFGQWITNFDWSDVFQISDCALKFDKFVDIMSTMVDCYFPSKLTKIRYSDKPWMSPSLKFAIEKRQIAFRKHGKSSQAYKFWRGKVQRDVRAARTKYYSYSGAKLKDTNPSRWRRTFILRLLLSTIIFRRKPFLYGACGVL